jgi:hypothetical protein
MRIARYVTFAEDVGDDHPAVVAARAGLEVEPALLPPAMLGRDPSAVTDSIWFVEDDDGRIRIWPDRRGI